MIRQLRVSASDTPPVVLYPVLTGMQTSTIIPVQETGERRLQEHDVAIQEHLQQLLQQDAEIRQHETELQQARTQLQQQQTELQQARAQARQQQVSTYLDRASTLLY